MIGSVRGRLTVAAMLVVGAVAVAAALLAPRSVERALIDDRLDAEVPAEVATLESRVVVTTSTGDELGSPQLTTLFGPDIADLAASLDDVGALDRLRSFRADGSLVVVPVTGVVGQVDADGRVRVDNGTAASTDGPVITGARLQQLADVLNPTSVFGSPYDIFADGGTSLDDFLTDLQDRFDADLGPLLDLGDLGDFGEFGDLESIGDELFSDDFLRDLQRNVLDPPGADGTDRLGRPQRTVDHFVFGTRDVDGVDVIVAASTDGIDRTVERLRSAIWIAVPFAMLLTGLVTWLLAGRALRPVRAITDQTGRIRTGTLHERVPVPASNDEISALATEMNDMLDRLHHDDRRRRQFVADASHELRSPIASIHTQAEVVLAHTDDGDARDLAAGVLAESERLGTIVDDLLALARHDETLAPPGAIVDLDDIVITAAARPRRVPIETRQVSGGQVRGRPDELARAVSHLLDNAARHATSTVKVSLATIHDRVELTVDDDGPGVAPRDRERIFERFVRLDEARIRDEGGAGLGLAVVATVVTAAGGSISVETSDLGGARFVAAFPRPT
ncbi:MAG: ATP-binding protein [Ilumatobacteraceae bacterium]|nr:ATP-binding protein [Ilumatobacteraceae bacterium]